MTSRTRNWASLHCIGLYVSCSHRKEVSFAAARQGCSWVSFARPRRPRLVASRPHRRSPQSHPRLTDRSCTRSKRERRREPSWPAFPLPSTLQLRTPARTHPQRGARGDWVPGSQGTSARLACPASRASDRPRRPRRSRRSATGSAARARSGSTRLTTRRARCGSRSSLVAADRGRRATRAAS